MMPPGIVAGALRMGQTGNLWTGGPDIPSCSLHVEPGSAVDQL